MKHNGKLSIHRLYCLLAASLFLVFPQHLSADEAITDEPSPEEVVFMEEDAVEVVLDPASFFFTIGPVGILNTDRQSAPSPIIFSPGFGATIPVNRWLAFSPSVNAFTSYYLWRDDPAGGRAYPAEIENRTALVFSFLIDTPAVFYARSGNSTFSFGLGLSLLARIGFLTDGVPASEADDVGRINSFFYSGLRFLYPSAQLAYDFALESGIKAGVILKARLPLASLMEGRGLDGGIADIAFRISFPRKATEAEPAE